ncbi:hypothetical protein KAI87_07465 [Myxococcota bacterium]|nr:hypothetical protein [Myxococcota bacterium]
MSKNRNKIEAPIHYHQSSSDQKGVKNKDKEFEDSIEKLEEQASRQMNHIRYHSKDVPYHIVSRVFWGVFRLVPTPETTSIIVGVFARAMELFPEMKLYAAAVLSAHFHLQVQGEPEEIPAFVGYIKREISRRIGKMQNKTGPMWEGYTSLALPGPISEMASFRYIMKHGVKEGLVERPEEWPGLHSAKSVLTGKPLQGIWVDGTALSKALDQNKRRKKENRKSIKKEDFTKQVELRFHKLPHWESLSDKAYAIEMKTIVDKFVEKERRKRGGAPVLGAQQVMRMHIQTRKEWKPLPFHEGRKRLICWGPSHSPELRGYLAEYWEFQFAYKEAAKRFRAGELDVEFPEYSFRPSSFVRVAKKKSVA